MVISSSNVIRVFLNFLFKLYVQLSCQMVYVGMFKDEQASSE